MPHNALEKEIIIVEGGTLVGIVGYSRQFILTVRPDGKDDVKITFQGNNGTCIYPDNSSDDGYAGTVPCRSWGPANNIPAAAAAVPNADKYNVSRTATIEYEFGVQDIVGMDFLNMPETHDGSEFTFNLNAGVVFGITNSMLESGFVTTNVESVEVTGTDPQKTVTVVPASANDVSIAFRRTYNCEHADAICTSGGGRLWGVPGVTVEYEGATPGLVMMMSPDYQTAVMIGTSSNRRGRPVTGVETISRCVGDPFSATKGPGAPAGDIVYSLLPPTFLIDTHDHENPYRDFSVDATGQIWTIAGKDYHHYESSGGSISARRMRVQARIDGTDISATSNVNIMILHPHDTHSHARVCNSRPAPQLSVADARGWEHQGEIEFEVTLNVAASQEVTVDYATTTNASTTAAAGDDFTATSGTLTFAPGETTKTVSVEIIDDGTEDSGETFILELIMNSASGAGILDGSAIGTILNDEVVGGITAVFEDVPENHDGSSDFTFTLTLSENIGDLSHRTLRDSAFTVTSGRIKRASRQVSGSNEGWNITVEPAGSGEVTVTLPETTDCAATGALCTTDDRALTGSVTASIPGPSTVTEPTAEQTESLTASFADVPEGHDGSTPFTFTLTLSENIDDLSYRTLRDSAFTVTGGRIRSARRQVSGSNEGWNITVEPAGLGTVRVTLPATTGACTATGAMCTSDDRALSNTSEATIAGPPALTVLDAAVDERPNAALEFTVSLGRAASGTVTVDYATSDVSATAGDDYTAASGTVSFAAGEIAKTVSVTVLDDAHDEGSETLTLTLSNASGAWIEDGTATGTIRNSDHMPREWLARFGRTVADQVLDAVEGRMTASRSAGAEVSLAGRTIGGSLDGDEAAVKFESLAERFGGEDDGDVFSASSREMTALDLLTGSSFALTGGSAESGFGSLWGRGAVTRFDGREGDLTLDGEVASAILGADFTRGRGTVGLALAHSSGDGSYRSSAGDGGEVESELTGFYPWARYEASERASMWGVVGYGTGTVTLTPDTVSGAATETDIDLTMGAVGASGVLLQAPEEGGLELVAKTDALMMRISSDEVRRSNGAGNLEESESGVTRLRLGLEGTWHGIGTEGGQTILPTVKIGMRQDGGDAETGFGTEVGAGITWSHPAAGIEARVSARGLLTHEDDDFRERGFSGSLTWDPDASSGRGPSLSFNQTVGAAATTGMDDLFAFDGTTVRHANENAMLARRFDARFGYGFAVLGGGWTGTPELGLGWSETVREARFGWRLTEARNPAFEFRIEGTRIESDNDDGEHRIGLGLTTRW